jgi:uncharacterized membrane protein required for colicin V production
MLSNIFQQLNWVDILVALILLKVCYTAAKNGLPIEFFKFLGTITAIFISLHYYVALSDLALKGINNPKMSLEFVDFLSFLVLALVSYLLFVFLRKITLQLIKIEAVSTLNKWGGFILGAGRAVLLSSLVIFALTISSINYFKDSAMASYSGKRLFRVCANTYRLIWNNAVSRFMTNEKLNKTIEEVEVSLKI